jgi:hypothetical protein
LKRAMATLYVMQNHIFLVLTGKRSTKIWWKFRKLQRKRRS